LSVCFPDANIGYAVGLNGIILKTTNAGTTWSPQLSGTSQHLRSVYFTDGTTGYAVGENGTIIKITSGGSTSVISTPGLADKIIPVAFTLEQNYPNPFNPTTSIGYQLSANSFTTLKIYDMIGREVATLVNEAKEAGTYTAQFDGARFSSGIYFARLSSLGKTQMRKLLLLK
jgi:hypothetical protein